MVKITRRRLLAGGVAAGAAFLAVRQLTLWVGGPGASAQAGLIRDPEGIIDLPEGFSYRVVSRTGDAMSDGLVVPGDPDGMAAFDGGAGRVVLVRNHELDLREGDKGAFGADGAHLAKLDKSRFYDLGTNGVPHFGGTTTLVYDPATGKVERQFLSLAGTLRNCCGGPTPWGSWLSCEETEDEKGVPGSGADHGYVFEVPAVGSGGLVDAQPLRAMGRFYHEAAAVDPDTGIVYMTEDRENGLFYRFIPDVKGQLARGGRLQALALGGHPAADTRNWESGDGPTMRLDKSHAVHWIDLEDVEARSGHLRDEGIAKGAAIFARGEGIVADRDGFYFAATSGGPARAGQIWRYRPGRFEGTRFEDMGRGHLELFVEPNDPQIMRMCDNITMAPWGDLIVCEDGPGDNYVRGITPKGRIYPLARAAAGTKPHAGDNEQKSEFAGACFSPDGKTFFVNLQEAQVTLAITGPWKQLSV